MTRERVAAGEAGKSGRAASNLQPGPWQLKLLRPVFRSGVFGFDPVDHTAAYYVEIHLALPAEAAVLRWHLVGSLNVRQVLALGIEHLDARRGGGEEVALVVDAQAVGAADHAVIGFLLEGVHAEVCLVLERAVGVHVVGDEIRAVPVIDVELLFVRA